MLLTVLEGGSMAPWQVQQKAAAQCGVGAVAEGNAKADGRRRGLGKNSPKRTNSREAKIHVSLIK